MKTRITHQRTEDTPAGNPTYWIFVDGPTSDYRRAGHLAGARAREIAKTLGPLMHAYRITSGTTWNGPEKTFQERVFYAFSTAEIYQH